MSLSPSACERIALHHTCSAALPHVKHYLCVSNATKRACSGQVYVSGAASAGPIHVSDKAPAPASPIRNYPSDRPITWCASPSLPARAYIATIFQSTAAVALARQPSDSQLVDQSYVVNNVPTEASGSEDLLLLCTRFFSKKHSPGAKPLFADRTTVRRSTKAP